MNINHGLWNAVKKTHCANVLKQGAETLHEFEV